MNNYNIIFFNVESKTEDNGTYEVINTCKTDGNKFYTVRIDTKRFELYNNINNVFVGWDNEKEFRELGLKAKYLDLSKAYTSIILGKKPNEDIRSLTELKITEDINFLHDTIAMAKIDQRYNITDKVFALMETTGIGNPNSVFYPTSCLEFYIAKNKIPIKSNNDNTNKGYNLGGLNIIGENKRYENLKHFDVKSMYPNILISLQASSNLKYLNLKCSTVKELTGDWELINETKETAFYIQENGLKQARFKNGEYKILELDSKFDLTEANNDIANLFKDLLQYKENNTGNLRIAYKKLVNGLYGALYSDEHFKYSHVNLTVIATFIGRYILYNCYKEFNGVYAKTDSIWTTNKNITEEDLNNYSNDKLLIKDSNKYVEVIGDEYDFKGGCEAPIQEIVLKKAIQGERVNPNNLFNEYKDQIILFCKHPKYSTSQENQDRFNKVLTKIKGYTIEPNKKCYQYFSIHGWVNGLEIDQFNLEVDEDYGLNLITKILYDYDFTENIHEFNITKKYEAPKYVPMYLGEEERLIQNNSRLDSLFRVEGNNYSIKDRLQELVLPYSSEYQYEGIVLGTNYYAIDIDRKDFNERTEIIKDEILKLFKKDEFVLQETKSNGYHIIFKTKHDLTGFEPTSTKEGYEGLELKVNAVLPFNTYKYHVIKHSSRYNVFDGLDKIVNFKEIDKLKRFYGYDETKKTKKINITEDNVKDFKELDKLTSQLVELSNLVFDNHHDLSLAIGGSLRGLLNTEDIEQLSKDLEEGTTSKEVTARTIKDGYEWADPTDSLGLLVKFIEKQPNKKELMEVFKLIKEGIKINEINNVVDMNNKETDNNIIIESIAKSIVKNKHDFKQLKRILHELKYNPGVVETIFNEIHEFYQEREQEIINKFLEISNVNTVDTLYKTYKLQIKGIALAEEELGKAHSDALREGNEYLIDSTELAQKVLKKLVGLCNIMSITKDYIYSCFAKSLLKLGYDRRALTGEIYRFTETGWEHIPLDIFKANVNEVYNNNVSDKDIDRVLQYLNTLPNPNYNMVQFLNCQYNMETHEYQETDKDIFPLLKIPYNYNPKAEPTYIHDFLSSSLPNYELKTILEVIGWLFTSGNEEQKMLWLTSTGGGGKSVLGNILRAIFHNQTCSVDLGKIERFDNGKFIGKQINICSEIDRTTIAKSKTYKEYTGNEPIPVERKFKDGFELPKEEVPKQIQICNNMPKFDSLEDPLMERFLLLEFKHKFRGTDKEEQGLDNKIIESKEDMEWLIYNSLEAYREMKQDNRKKFLLQLSIEETRKRVIADNEPLIPAIEQLLEFDYETSVMKESEMIEANELKEKLTECMKEQGRNVIHDKTGTINNKAIVNSIKTVFDVWDETWINNGRDSAYTTIRKSVNGKRSRYFPLIKFKEEQEPSDQRGQDVGRRGQENQKPAETNTKQNKTPEIYYEEVEDIQKQPKQKTLI